MGKLIDEQTAYDVLTDYYHHSTDTQHALEMVPTVDAVPVRHGRWIRHVDDLFPAESTQECDQCHEEQPLTCDDNYCPNCGAKMNEEDNEQKKQF